MRLGGGFKVDLDLAALMETLPDDAKFDTPPLTTKSYTKKIDDSDVTIGVILNRKAFYVCPVQYVPPLPLFEGLEINKQGGVQVHFGDDPGAAWEIAKAVAAW